MPQLSAADPLRSPIADSGAPRRTPAFVRKADRPRRALTAHRATTLLGWIVEARANSSKPLRRQPAPVRLRIATGRRCDSASLRADPGLWSPARCAHYAAWRTEIQLLSPVVRRHRAEPGRQSADVWRAAARRVGWRRRLLFFFFFFWCFLILWTGIRRPEDQGKEEQSRYKLFLNFYDAAEPHRCRKFNPSCANGTLRECHLVVRPVSRCDIRPGPSKGQALRYVAQTSADPPGAQALSPGSRGDEDMAAGKHAGRGCFPIATGRSSPTS